VRARGVTLIEAMVAMLVVAVLGLAAHGVSRTILATQDQHVETGFIDELGISLLEEIASLPFDDPQDGGTALGPEAGEWVALGDRALFDDVDDYTVWNGSRPLQQKDGSLIDVPGYTRGVSIAYVNPADFKLASFTPSDCKQITVSVRIQGRTVKTFSTVRVEGGRYVDSDG
jgi:hypothetical protein